MIIANILALRPHSNRKQQIDGIEVIIIPALLVKEDSITIPDETWNEIRRCIREYSY